jgi:hypothetical protein
LLRRAFDFSLNIAFDRSQPFIIDHQRFDFRFTQLRILRKHTFIQRFLRFFDFFIGGGFLIQQLLALFQYRQLFAGVFGAAADQLDIACLYAGFGDFAFVGFGVFQ